MGTKLAIDMVQKSYLFKYFSTQFKISIGQPISETYNKCDAGECGTEH